MNFEKVLPALRAGKKIRRKDWVGGYIYKVPNTICDLANERGEEVSLSLNSIINFKDWEIVKA